MEPKCSTCDCPLNDDNNTLADGLCDECFEDEGEFDGDDDDCDEDDE